MGAIRARVIDETDHALPMRKRSAPAPDSSRDHDLGIQSHIEAALRRRFGGKEHDIVVSVVGRNVILSGIVSGWWHRDQARNMALAAPGVEHLTDRMALGF